MPDPKGLAAAPFRYLMRLVLGSWIPILGTALACALLCFAYTANIETVYEARTFITLRKTQSAANSVLEMGQNSGLNSQPAGRLEYLKRALTSDEVLSNVAAHEGITQAFFPDSDPPPSTSRVLERLRKAIRVQTSIPNQLLLINVEAPHPAIAPRLLVLLHQELQKKVRSYTQEKAWGASDFIEGEIARSTDPYWSQQLRARQATVRERAQLLGPDFIDILVDPRPPQYRSKPNRKQMLALAFLLGGFLAALVIVARDASVRRLALNRLRMPLRGEIGEDGSIGWFRATAAIVLLFMLIYNLSFQAFPSALTGRIAFLILCVWGWKRNAADFMAMMRTHPVFFAVFGFVFAYSIVAYRLGSGDSVQVSRMFHFFILSICASIVYLNFIGRNWSRFHLYFMIVVGIQAVLHLYSFFSLDYRLWVSGVLVQGGNLDMTLGSRPPAFVNAAGAAFSVTQALGLFSALLVLRRVKSRSALIVGGLFALTIFLSSMLAGRTGMLICLLLLLFTAFSGTPRSRYASALIMGFSALGVVLFLDQIRLFLFFIDPAFERDFSMIISNALEIFNNRGRVGSAVHVYNMEVPDLTVETFLGTGLTRVRVGEGHDAGYVQTYLSIGLVMASVFYLSLLALLMKYFLRLPRQHGVMVLMVTLMFLVEAKEPFIFKYAFPFYVITCFRLLVPESPGGDGQYPAKAPA